MHIQYNLDCKKILIAIKELELWEKRRNELAENLALLKDSNVTNKTLELKKINRQISYYDSLTKDMKKQFKPTTMDDFLSSI